MACVTEPMGKGNSQATTTLNQQQTSAVTGDSTTVSGEVITVKADIALHGNPISELRDVTCHTGSQC